MVNLKQEINNIKDLLQNIQELKRIQMNIEHIQELKDTLQLQTNMVSIKGVIALLMKRFLIEREQNSF